jgi:transcriptional regulator with XRE-family HTH domain
MSAVCFDGAMPMTRTLIQQETVRRMRHLDLKVGDDIRRIRTDAGISRAALAEAVDVDRSHLTRIEAGIARPSLTLLTGIGAALGADLSVRYFAGVGPRLHDRFQAPMTDALLRSLHPRWGSELEVPVTRPSRGVIDIILSPKDPQPRPALPDAVASELQSEMRRLEETIRWSNEKADGLQERLRLESGDNLATVSRLLVLRSTVAMREVATRFAGTLAIAYPARSADVFDALTSTAPWPGAGIVWMRVERGVATLLRFPPRGVSLGR